MNGAASKMKSPKKRQKPLYVTAALYQRACRAAIAVADRRGILGIAVDSDRDARRWQAWNIAAMRQIWAGCFGPLRGPDRPQTLPRRRRNSAAEPGNE